MDVLFQNLSWEPNNQSILFIYSYVMDFYFLVCLVSENFTCEFDDCSQLCVNISSEVNCSCELGYELEADGINCTGML